MTSIFRTMSKMGFALAALLGGPGYKAVMGAGVERENFDAGTVRAVKATRFRKSKSGQKTHRRRPHKNAKWIGRNKLHPESKTHGWVFFRP